MSQQDTCFTFSDEDFDRRYSGEEQGADAPAADTQPRPASQTKTLIARLGRSRNRFMRTLIRRRLAASGQI